MVYSSQRRQFVKDMTQALAICDGMSRISRVLELLVSDAGYRVVETSLVFKKVIREKICEFYLCYGIKAARQFYIHYFGHDLLDHDVQFCSTLPHRNVDPVYEQIFFDVLKTNRQA